MRLISNFSAFYRISIQNTAYDFRFQFTDRVVCGYLSDNHLDDLLLRRFWTPDYKKKLESEFEKIKMPEMAKKTIIKRTEDYSSYEESRSRKRGGLLFSFTVILLIIIGFSGHFSYFDELSKALILILMSLSVLVIYLFDDGLLKNWWSVLWAATLVPAITTLLLITAKNIRVYQNVINGDYDWLVLISKVLVVLTLVLPVIWQLVRNWIYTRYYLNFIIDQTTIKAKEYDGALRFDVAKGHKVQDVAQPYHDAVVQAVAAGKGDRQITLFMEVLQGELETIEYVPTLMPLIKYSYRSYKKNHLTNKKFQKLYKKYQNIPKAPKMEKYCEDEGVSFERFKEYHLKQIGRR